MYYTKPATQTKTFAEKHGKEASTVRQKAERGGFKTARKIGRNWIIDSEEPYEDLRKRK